MQDILLSIKNLHVTFDTYAGKIYAVNGMSFNVHKGEIFGLVGESGCGKSVTSLAIMRILPGKGKISEGNIFFHGEDLLVRSEEEMSRIRGRQISMIFQDPSASLNPVFTIGNQIVRIIRYQTGCSAKEARQKAISLFEEVSLPDPERMMKTYPHELSGGMQQRVMIAMAIASGAELLIADEPTTALDVTIQNQILELLKDLREKEGLSILLITHNLGVVAETCDRVAVAYAGQVVETGPTQEILQNMKHPYTTGLLAALPNPKQKDKELQSIPGNVPTGLSPIQGCAFYPRCFHRMDICREKQPPFIQIGSNEHMVSCFLYSKEAEHV